MNQRAALRHHNPGTTEAIADELALIEHSQCCSIGDVRRDERCPDRRCRNMKSVLYHGMLCDRGVCCYVEGCYQIRSLSKHLRRCADENCGPCEALRDREDLIARGESVRPPRFEPAIAKRRLQIQVLQFILHIHKCQMKDSRPGDCRQVNCEDLEEALLHIPVCQLHSACPFPGCTATGYALSHWKLCETGECLVCEPVRLNLMAGINSRYPPTHKPKDRYFISQHIEQLLHALNCAERDRELDLEEPNCKRANCELIKRLLRHLPNCNDDKCKTAQCSASKRILKHLKVCSELDCPSCANEPRDRPLPRARPNRPGSSRGPPAAPQIPDMYPASMAAPSLEVPTENGEAVRTMLLALLHAAKCLTKSGNGKAGLELTPCHVIGCGEVLQVYHHLVQCNNYTECDDQCTISRTILHHWKTCNNEACALCFREVIVRRR